MLADVLVAPWQELERLRAEVDRAFSRFTGAGEPGMGVARPATRARELADA